jgi:hypothetical protein
VIFYYAYTKSVLVGEKMSTDTTRILTDSAGGKNRKEALANYNKTRMNIGHQHDRWMELKEVLRVQTHAQVSLCMVLGDKLHTKLTKIQVFWSHLAKRHFIFMVLRIY